MEEKEFETVIPKDIKPIEYEKVIELSFEDTLDLKDVIKEIEEKEKE